MKAETKYTPAGHDGQVTNLAGPQRLAFVDNLRWVMIVLVVSMHAAVTYCRMGSWYFMEESKPGIGLIICFATYQTCLQAFFMGLLFLIAGYFVPGAFDRKGLGRFVRDRAIRLGVPTLLYMLMIHPFIVYWLLRNFGHPELPSLTAAYGPYISRGRFLGSSGPMWFALALLLFSIGYGLLRGTSQSRPKTDSPAPLPAHGQVIGLIVVMGLCTFLVRTVQPTGTSVMNFQLCYFSQYILLFAVGILAWRRNWLARIPSEFGLHWFGLAWTVGLFAWFGLIAAILVTRTEAKLAGGFTWQSAALCFWESFFCVGQCLGWLVIFRDRFNSQGPVARWLSDNSFAVYFFHPPVLIAITLAMRGLSAPKPVKFLCATILAVAATYLASSLLLRRIPLLKRVL
ncbi:MAG: acyltransferase family protein [Limisphaerales bacterium]